MWLSTRFAAPPLLPAEGHRGLLREAWHRYRGILPAHPGQVERHDHQHWQEGTLFRLKPPVSPVELLRQYNKDPAQTLVRWSIQRG